MIGLTKFSYFASLATLAVANGNVCQQQPYLAIEVLSNYPPAESFCSMKFPLAQCTSTKVSTVTSSATTTIGTVTTTTGTSTITNVGGTVTSTTDTATVTDTSTTGTITSLVYSTSTQTSLVTSTSTIYNEKRAVALIKRPGASKRQAKLEYFKKRNGGSNPQATALSSLINFADKILSTACSCIETPKPCLTVTSTSTVKSTSSVKATSDVEASSTTVVTSTVVVSQVSTTILYVQTTTTTTSDKATTTTAGTQATQTVLADCTAGCTSYGGVDFLTTCGSSQIFTGASNSYVNSAATTYVECADACGEEGECNAFSYQGETSTCTLYDNALNYGANVADSDAGYGIYVNSC